MVLWIHFGYPLPRFFRTDGPGLLTTSRLNDFELYRPARRAGFTLKRLLKRASERITTLLYCPGCIRPLPRAWNHRLGCPTGDFQYQRSSGYGAIKRHSPADDLVWR